MLDGCPWLQLKGAFTAEGAAGTQRKDINDPNLSAFLRVLCGKFIFGF